MVGKRLPLSDLYAACGEFQGQHADELEVSTGGSLLADNFEMNIILEDHYFENPHMFYHHCTCVTP